MLGVATLVAAGGALWWQVRTDEAERVAPARRAAPVMPAATAAPTPGDGAPAASVAATASGQAVAVEAPGAAPAGPSPAELAAAAADQPQTIALARGLRGQRVLDTGEVPPPSLGGDPLHGRAQLPDGRGSAQLAHAPVTAQELGLQPYPNATVDSARSMLVQDAVAGSMASVTLSTREPLDQVVAFYRQQMRAAGPFQETRRDTDQIQMEGMPTGTGARRTVSIWRDGPDVRITIIRATPPSGPRG